MSEPLISGEITIFGTDNKPLFSLTKSGCGEWHHQYFKLPTEAEAEESIEITHRSARRLQEFMTFHGGE